MHHLNSECVIILLSSLRLLQDTSFRKKDHTILRKLIMDYTKCRRLIIDHLNVKNESCITQISEGPIINHILQSVYFAPEIREWIWRMGNYLLFVICYPLFSDYINKFTLYPCISIISCYHIFLPEYVKHHHILSMSSWSCLTTHHALVILEKAYGVYPAHLYFTSWSSFTM